MNADANAELGQAAIGKALFHPIAKPFCLFGHAYRRNQRAARVVGMAHGRTENCHHRVADVLVHHAALLQDGLASQAEIGVKHLHHFVRGQFFRDGGEVADIREQHRDLKLLARQVRPLALGQQLDDIIRNIASEHLPQLRFLPLFAGKAQAQGDQKRHRQPDLWLSHRQHHILEEKQKSRYRQIKSDDHAGECRALGRQTQKQDGRQHQQHINAGHAQPQGGHIGVMPGQNGLDNIGVDLPPGHLVGMGAA